MQFIHVQLKRTNEFNRLFESDKPMLHSLDINLKTLIKEIMSDYIQLNYVRNCNPYTLDFHDINKRIPINQVYVGINATTTLKPPSMP